jgi:hypothetical protein
LILQFQAGQGIPGGFLSIGQRSSVFRLVDRCVDRVPFPPGPPTVCRGGDGDSHTAGSSDQSQGRRHT